MSEKLSLFLEGFSTAVGLMVRAAKNGFAIEFLCLAASVIDGTLRMGLVLKHQLDSKSNEVPVELLFQAEEDKIITEREIYKRSLQKAIIDQEVFDKLESLYKDRNRVIHRYMISRITTDQVFIIATQYECLIPIIQAAVKRIEDEQMNLSIGMTKHGNDVPDTIRRNLEADLDRMAVNKHGDPNLAQRLKNDAS